MVSQTLGFFYIENVSDSATYESSNPLRISKIWPDLSLVFEFKQPIYTWWGVWGAVLL